MAFRLIAKDRASGLDELTFYLGDILALKNARMNFSFASRMNVFDADIESDVLRSLENCLFDSSIRSGVLRLFKIDHAPVVHLLPHINWQTGTWRDLAHLLLRPNDIVLDSRLRLIGFYHGNEVDASVVNDDGLIPTIQRAFPHLTLVQYGDNGSALLRTQIKWPRGMCGGVSADKLRR